jgi:serine/threonine protein kinase
MYSTPLDAEISRISASHLPLMYQWALHLISGLSFIHTHDIVFGDLTLAQCWLSSDSHLSLSLAGFSNAGFRDRSTGGWFDGDRSRAEFFHLLEHQRNPTMQTDLLMYGCVVYELMTGAWPGSRLTGTSGQDVAMRIPSRRWLPLETEHMGEIVHKCWAGGFENAEQVKAEVIAFLEGLGWEIEGNDDLVGFNVAELDI